MLASSIPTKFPIPFANSAGASFIRPVPVASQIGINPGAASDTDGFVPLNFLVPSAGGIPPDGRDVNGILNQITAWNQWQSVGGPIYYDAAQSTAVGGYPHGAILNAVGIQAGYWWSQVDNNTTDPDTGGANWFFIQLGNATTFVPVVPATTWFVDQVNGTDVPGQGLTAGAGAFKTGTYAVATIEGFFSAVPVTINFAAATYAGFAINASSISSWNLVGSGVGSCTISATTIATNAGRGLVVKSATVTISGFTVTAFYECVVSDNTSVVQCYNCNIVGVGSTSIGFGAYYGSTLFLYNFVRGSTTSAAFTISGSFEAVFYVSQSGSIGVAFNDAATTANVTITFGTTAAAQGVALAQTAGTIQFTVGHITWAGSTPTGPRYNAGSAGGVQATGGGTSYIPGSSPGTLVTSTYGWYVP